MGSKRSGARDRTSVRAPRALPQASKQWSPERRDAAICALLAAAVLVVWLVTLRNGFVSYDDEVYVVRNPHVLSGLTAKGIAWALTTEHGGYWHPVTWISHMLDVQLFGNKPAGHHATSLLLHLANTLLLYRILSNTTGAPTRGAMVALLFALHPLRVESVAWIAERKDLLGVFFGLLSVLAYAAYASGKGRARYVASLVFFALSLASKPMLVTLPFLLLLLDWWPLERWKQNKLRALVVEKLPLLALSAVSSVVTYLGQRHEGATAALKLSFLARLDNAVLSYARYIGKLLWPSRLAALYPHSGVTHGLTTLAAAALLLGATAACLALRKRRPYLAVGWFWYVGTLVPVIGLIQVGWQAMADRYTYLPTIGLLLIAVWGIADLARDWSLPVPVVTSLSAAALIALSVLTIRQIRTWRDSITLFQHALSVTDRNDTMEINLGNAFFREGRLEEAKTHFERAEDICRDCPDARFGLGVVLAATDRPEEAAAKFEDALRLQPDLAEAHRRLGLLFISQKKWNDAVSHLRKALVLQPDSPEILYALGAALEGQDRLFEAANQYEAALRLKPDYGEAHSNLGLLLLGQGKPAEALPHLRETVRLYPNLRQPRVDLGQCLKALGRQEEAARELGEALRIPRP